jgi:hypothetical protein
MSTSANDVFRLSVTAETNLHVRTDDAFLLKFLRARKFNCAKAFHMVRLTSPSKQTCKHVSNYNYKLNTE